MSKVRRHWLIRLMSPSCRHARLSIVAFSGKAAAKKARAMIRWRVVEIEPGVEVAR